MPAALPLRWRFKSEHSALEHTGLMSPGGPCSLSRFRLSGLARIPCPGSRTPGDLAGSGLFGVVVYLGSAKTRPCRPVRRGRVRFAWLAVEAALAA
jgi:hypothetical protein